MTVHDIFDLRKQGRIEEAYDAIRPMYAQHKGRYTTLCMFWTGADVFKLRLEQGRTDEAEKIYRALLRLLPRVEEITKELNSRNASSSATPPAQDNDDSKLPWERNPEPISSAATFLQNAHRRLSQLENSHPSKKIEGVSAVAMDVMRTSSQMTESQQGSAGANPQNSSDSSDSWSLSQPQQTVLNAIRTNPGARIPALSETTGIPAKTLERHIASLTAIHLIEHRGSKKTGGYYTIINTLKRYNYESQRH